VDSIHLQGLHVSKYLKNYPFFLILTCLLELSMSAGVWKKKGQALKYACLRLCCC
jgi:hypothetical protein